MAINFALLLLVLVVLTGGMWLADVLYFSKRRQAMAAEAVAEFDARHAAMVRATGGDQAVNAERERRRADALRQPAWIEYTASFFPVIALVFFVRSFVVEPFKIPSGSMIPTLLVGDLILVNKFSYGVRLPIVHTKLFSTGSPQRGDVMVFRWPKDQSFDYIKRVVGIPGDEVIYDNKKLTINGVAVPTESLPDFFDPDRVAYSKRFSEKLGQTDYQVLNDENREPFTGTLRDFPHRDACTYTATSMRCKVPEGHYMMMGDNRDNSSDSREWGFVPERNIVGKAFFIWMNFSDLKRIGRFE